MRAEINRRWLLVSRSRSALAEADFRCHEAPRPNIGGGQFLVRTLYVSVDPGLRGRLTRSPENLSQAPGLYPDALFVTPALGQVIESRHPEYAVGDFVSGLFGWQEYCASDGAAQVPVFRFKRVHPLPRYLSVLGDNGMTAYFGMLDVGRPREGETVLVSGAAGATGSIAAQIAKIRRCRVIGIADGDEKRRRLTEQFGLDAAIDCESEDLEARLKELCPDGVNVYFDSVGGRTLDIVLSHMAIWGRIAVCGSISHCDRDGKPAGPADLVHLAARRIRMEGFLALDYSPRHKEARRQLSAWLASGALRSCEHIHEGFENIPRAFVGLFHGADMGEEMAMVKLADPV